MYNPLVISPLIFQRICQLSCQLSCHHSRRLWRSFFALLACALLLTAPAQADPAGRIGRVAWLSGDINLYNTGSGESYLAPLNQPLTSGDILTTEAGSRAEIQIGSMTVRLDQGSVLEFNRIDDEQVRLFLNSGRVIVKLPSAESVRDFELVSRNGRFSARNTGIYRFDAQSNSSSGTAYYGSLHFEANDSALAIGAGQSADFWSAGQTRYRLMNAINDEFTQWSAARDQRPTSNDYARYVSPEMTGAEDLDAYGNWSENPEYGAMWTPRAVAADWAPYRSGHWAWVDPWGWNWVGDEPWGFAPFHYGRWVRHHGAWGWVPGTRIARPVYAPAMVAWIGTPGIRGALAVGARPTVGWFPLAPREVYIPSYRSSAQHIRSVNSTHVAHLVNANNIASNPQAAIQHTRYAHRELPQALTVVPADVVTRRRPVAPAAFSARDQGAFRQQPVQVAAPVAAPQTGRSERQQRPGQPPNVLRERDPAAPVFAAPAAPGNRAGVPPMQVPAAPAPLVAPQRTQRPMPEAVRPLPQSGRDDFDARRQEAATPFSAQVDRRNPPGQPGAAGQSFSRRESEQQAPPVAPPYAPRYRDALPQSPALQAAPAAPATPFAPQRAERPLPEAARPAPQPRPDAFEARRQESALRPPQREMRSEPALQQAIRQAPAARVESTPPPGREARREPPPVGRPAEAPRAAPGIQRNEERQRPAQDERWPQRQRPNDAERR